MHAGSRSRMSDSPWRGVHSTTENHALVIPPCFHSTHTEMSGESIQMLIRSAELLSSSRDEGNA